MAMGKKGEQQDELFVPYRRCGRLGIRSIARSRRCTARAWVRSVRRDVVCAFYHPVMWRRGLAPGNYFRSLVIDYFEGIDSERGIAWRLATR
jgi:transposase